MTSIVWGQAFATTISDEVLKEEDIQQLAEMPLDTATPEMKEKILEARNEIIFGQSWAADGVELYVERRDGTVEKVPEFSELFPGWEVPVIDSSSDVEEDSEIIAGEEPEIMPLSVESASFRVYLRNPTSGKITSPFLHFPHNGSYVRTKVDVLYASEHCNIGYSDYNTGKQLGYVTELYPTDLITMYTLGADEFECAVRASTYSSPGYSILTVAHDIPIPSVR